MDIKDREEDSESIGSDESEEESELDEEESEKRRADCVAGMKELESQFLKLKEELIHEKFTLIDKKLFEIENETAKEYTVPLLKLKENMESRIAIATSMKEYRLENIKNIFLCEEETVKQSLENDKILLFDSLKEKIEAEINQIEESRRLLYLELKRHELYENESEINQNNNLNNNNTKNGTNNQINNLKRKLNKKSANDEVEQQRKNKKTITVTGPYIVYSLSDLDILEDWLVIKDHLENNDNENNEEIECIDSKNK